MNSFILVNRNLSKLEIDLPESDVVNLKVIDVHGKQILNLNQGNMAQGRHDIFIETYQIPSGVYFIILETNNYRAQDKLIVIR